ncbi:NAD-dependent epimerase/dehydratase family protein [Anaeromyxobacter diazotrophicus]|uniref:Epimerase/dehydratase n=1 Tax=Anaeromyxobacter diazotrophicus TaxID=2590199 RepID=A0A7I9VGA6_9BACT|nr:sugar nucleotide-binding protein [Anaeromyxobacter diazotrophicus]GEJ55432.1 epimerase/dehydratase [Anaeromyxobacter diazotrophicus]
MDVLITGITGGLGRALAARLAGARITGTCRRAEVTLEGARVVAAELGSVDWAPLVQGQDVVFHLAAYVHRKPAGLDEEAAVFELNAGSTARLAQACRQSGAILVFASTVAVLEGAEPRGRRAGTAYGQSKLAAEAAIRREGEAGLRFAIVRFPLLYGPYGRGNMEKMLQAIASRRYWPIGPSGCPKSCLAFDDAARALIACATDPAALGQTYVAAPPVAPTLGEIHRAAYAALGRRLPPAVPGALAVALALAAEAVLALLGHRARLREQVETLIAPAAYDGGELASAVGFRPEVSLHEGLRGLADWLRSRREAGKR